LQINALPNVMGLIGGTHRPICRPTSQNALNRQRECYNGWLHKHCLGFQSIVTPDGLFASLCGPFPGSRNDLQKLALSGLLPTLQQHLPNYRLLGDAGYTFNPNSQIARNIPCVWAQNSANGRYNARVATVREAVEWPFAHVTSTFRMLDDRAYMTCATPIRVMYKNACLLHNCLLCMGYGNREVSSFFGCAPPSLATYLS
jgi:hypothetical protein